ncbi:MarR family winged helix-turn-helix transcriptional regulator [Sphingobium lignivorans]|uniref:DNA-binding MarR family transcriptional regulator n=1 Tax=Sphingobium lignivorans TaxID=2735886 RepID=A0ABR6NEL0_9SPHN|nr:MarR family transcriptional regulator [Sphingobium lignivorans]MBB5984953.1 DNA-binding MarR family transcriptional regulator [Sphingobium lignivorans]
MPGQEGALPAASPDPVREAGPLEEAWSIFDARHLPYRLLMLGKMLDRISTQQVRDVASVSLAEWRVLAHIAVMGSRSASEVSVAALVDRAEVSRGVRSLEEKGYLTRVNNPRNRKSSLLVLTPAGADVYERMQQQRRAFYSVLTADLNAGELQMLDELLLRIARRADGLARERPFEAGATE